MLFLAWVRAGHNSADTLPGARLVVNAPVRGANPLSGRVLARPFWVL